ncbi:MAG: patatin-like phospholipase family protein [Ilumatobacteraceae bacterium]
MSAETSDGAVRDHGICLSGGGHRATVFGWGALLALADAGLHRRTLSISSVSGGSIANGAVMIGPDYGTSEPGEIEDHLTALVRAVASRGVLLGGAPATRSYLRSLIAALGVAAAGLIVIIVAAVVSSGWWMLIGAVVLALASVVAWKLFARRSVVTERAIDTELLGGGHTTLAELAARHLSINHVICTTELQSGVSCYFGNRLVYGWQFGGTTAPPALALSTPVQASACVTGLFRPRAVPLSDLHLDGHKPPKIDDVVLVDGGVYDNMADEWEYGFESRSTWKPLAAAQAHAPAGSSS